MRRFNEPGPTPVEAGVERAVAELQRSLEPPSKRLHPHSLSQQLAYGIRILVRSDSTSCHQREGDERELRDIASSVEPRNNGA